jgi:hypothetical protein
VMTCCLHAGLLDSGRLRFRPMTLPDRFIEHGDYRDQLAEAGLTSGQIAGTVLQVCVGRSGVLAGKRLQQPEHVSSTARITTSCG